MFRTFASSAAAAALTLALTTGVSAQERSTEFESRGLRGLTFTPSMGVGATWDSNLAIAANQAAGQQTERGTFFVLEPQGLLEFRNNRTEFTGGYKGYVRRYFDVDQLNGFDQRMFLSLQRLATKRLTLFVRDEFADVPSTDEVLLNGIPFLRTGSKSNRLAAGIEMRLTKYDEIAVRYDNIWVSFDNTSTLLRGGFLNEARVDYGRRLSERLTVGSEYRLRRAAVNNATEIFWFHDIGGTVAYELGPHLSIRAASGYSVIRDASVSGEGGGAYMRAELTRDIDRATSGIFYERSFAPSFGFGGTSESQELRGFVHMPISRNRLYLQSSAGWRRTDPLERFQELDLDTFIVDSTAGYSASRSVRLEVFHIYTRQDTRITGGEINRHRVGVQFVISQPMRIR